MSGYIDMPKITVVRKTFHMKTAHIFGPSLSKKDVGALTSPLLFNDGEVVFRKNKGKSCIEQSFKGRLGYLQQYNIVVDESVCIPIEIKQSDLYVAYSIHSRAKILLSDSENRHVLSLHQGRALYAYLPKGNYNLTLSPGKYQLFGFYFDVGMFDDGGDREFSFLKPLLEAHRNSSSAPLMSTDFSLDAKTEAYIHALCLRIKTGDLSSQIYMFTTMKDLIKLSKTKIEEKYEPKNYKKTIVEAAKIILESNVEAEGVRYKLTAVADRLAISLNYLQIIFKVESGETLSQFKGRIIVEKAKKLMRDGKMPKETSELCGFENLPAFYRFFKRETQMTPKDYILDQPS